MASPSMRAAVCTGPGRLALQALPVPEPQPGEVRVRVRACGICGSDLSLLPTGYLGSPVVPGHEMMGEVDALGSDVAGFLPGDAVAVEPLASCGRCPTCRDGRFALCPQLALLGVHRNGGFAEYVTVADERLFRLPSGLAPQVGALAEPMAVVVHGLRRAALRPGQRVLVLGAGTLGLLGVLAARGLGAAEVWLTARYPHQAKLGEAFGATRVLGETDATAEHLQALGREFPFDCVLETVGGAADTLQLAVEALRPGGVISVLGLFRSPIALNPLPLFVKEVTLAWSNCYDHAHGDADFATATRLLDEHRQELLGITTHQTRLDEATHAFELAASKQTGAVKVTVLI